MADLTLDNLENHCIPLADYAAKWRFMDEQEVPAPEEHQEQICILNKAGSAFLWNYEGGLGIVCSDKYFGQITEFDGSFEDEQTVKDYLADLDIPLSQKVFIARQPTDGFVLTWAMVIEYAHNLFFGDDQSVFDQSLGWRLEFHHDGLFTFGKGLMEVG